MQIPPDFYLFLFNFYEKFGRSPYLKLGLALLGLFVFLLLMAAVRRHFFKISMRGAVFGFLLGAALMIFVDFVIILGLADKAKVQKLVSQEERQVIIGEIFVSGVTNLGQVLGTSTMTLPRKPKTAQEIIADFLALPEEEAQKVRSLFCPE